MQAVSFDKLQHLQALNIAAHFDQGAPSIANVALKPCQAAPSMVDVAPKPCQGAQPKPLLCKLATVTNGTKKKAPEPNKQNSEDENEQDEGQDVSTNNEGDGHEVNMEDDEDSVESFSVKTPYKEAIDVGSPSGKAHNDFVDVVMRIFWDAGQLPDKLRQTYDYPSKETFRDLFTFGLEIEPSRAELNSRSTRSRVERNSKDGHANEGHEQVKVIEKIEIVMEEPIMQENEQGMEDADLVLVRELVSEPVPISEPVSKAPVLGSEDVVPAINDPVPTREDPVPLREEPEVATNKAQERQGKGFASKRPSNMEPLSDEAIILAKINKKNKEEL
ncbi:hypothetical protein L7F22_033036 [Adiantum nelumboides]|nr:hypothetical protein [Adiantum nelumboides]